MPFSINQPSSKASFDTPRRGVESPPYAHSVAGAGRVDIAVVRTGDSAGASGAGLLAALMFDAVGEGNSLIQVSGVASTPEAVPIQLQFSPASVTVR